MPSDDELITPRNFEYWKLTFRELAISPGWTDLSLAERARKLLDRVEQELSNTNAPPQRRALFDCSPEDRLGTARKMIEHFEEEDRKQGTGDRLEGTGNSQDPAD